MHGIVLAGLCFLLFLLLVWSVFALIGHRNAPPGDVDTNQLQPAHIDELEKRRQSIRAKCELAQATELQSKQESERSKKSKDKEPTDIVSEERSSEALTGSSGHLGQNPISPVSRIQPPIVTRQVTRAFRPDSRKSIIETGRDRHSSNLRAPHEEIGPSTKSPFFVSSLVQRFIDSEIHLYHFTNSSNWASIQGHGAIFSREQLQVRSITTRFVSSDGSRFVDAQRGLSSFVHLSFHPDHSMLGAVRYRTEDAIMVLQISLLVLKYPGCCFTRSLANANHAVRVPISEISEADMEEIRLATPDSKKWQLLVPGSIPVDLVRPHEIHEGLIPLWR